MVRKQLARLVSDAKQGGVEKSFVCYVDEKKEKKFLVFKFGGIYFLDSNGKIEKLQSLTDIEDIFLSIEKGDVKVIGSGNIGI